MEERKTENFAVLATRSLHAADLGKPPVNSALMHLRQTAEAAQSLQKEAVELSLALSGSAPPEDPSGFSPESFDKGLLAEIDTEAGDLRRVLENIRAVIGHMRGLVG